MPSVCVFCGSLNSVSDLFLAAARETGRLLAEAGWTAVYGGARNGMMGAFASAALAAGGRVTGVIPRALVEREVPPRAGRAARRRLAAGAQNFDAGVE